MRSVLAIILAAGVCCVGCGDDERAAGAPHPRIISFSPSVTDIVYDLGLGDHLVGVTSWCILPEGESRPVVGTEQKAGIERIVSLDPDLIFIHQDAAPFERVRELLPDVRIISTQTDELDGILRSIRTVADAAGAPDRGEALAGEVHARLDAVRERVAGLPRPRVLFVMGYDHPGTVGADTYIDDLITLAGGQNVAAEHYTYYPTINADMILRMAPEVLICQVNEDDVDAVRRYWNGLGDVPAVANGRVYVTTYDRMLIPGSRVYEVAELFARCIHPEAAATLPATGAATRGNPAAAASPGAMP